MQRKLQGLLKWGKKERYFLQFSKDAEKILNSLLKYLYSALYNYPIFSDMPMSIEKERRLYHG